MMQNVPISIVLDPIKMVLKTCIIPTVPSTLKGENIEKSKRRLEFLPHLTFQPKKAMALVTLIFDFQIQFLAKIIILSYHYKNLALTIYHNGCLG